MESQVTVEKKDNSLEEQKRSSNALNRISSRHIILGEVNRLLAAMRLNAHWASQNGRSSESPLLKGLKNLRSSLDSSSTVTPKGERRRKNTDGICLLF